jgi:hypothetical protein
MLLEVRNYLLHGHKGVEDEVGALCKFPCSPLFVFWRMEKMEPTRFSHQRGKATVQ